MEMNNEQEPNNLFDYFSQMQGVEGEEDTTAQTEGQEGTEGQVPDQTQVQTEVEPDEQGTEEQQEPVNGGNASDEGEQQEGEETGQVEDVNFYEDIYHQLGLEGELPKNYEDNPEGLVEFIKDYKDSTMHQFWDTLEENVPELYEMMIAANEGHDYRQLMKEYAGIGSQDVIGQELTENTNPKVLRNIITEGLKDTLSPDDIQNLIDDKEESGRLLEEAQRHQNRFRQQYEVEQARIAEQREIQREQYKQAIESNYNAVKQNLAEGKLEGISLPPNELNKFQEFLDKHMLATPNGQVVLSLDMTDKKALTAAYFVHNGGKFQELIQRQARTSNAKSIKNRFTTNKKSGSKPSKNTTSNKGRTSSQSALYQALASGTAFKR